MSGNVVQLLAVRSNRPPRRLPNSSVRSREYLTDAEVGLLMKTARGLGRHGARDAAIILIALRHALCRLIGPHAEYELAVCAGTRGVSLTRSCQPNTRAG